MKIPGVAEMVYANTNPAFSKMAVLSENLDKLEEIYDFIFKYKDYVDVLLDEYVRINHVALSDIDSLDNTKFKGLETTKLTVDGANYYGTITIGTIDNDNSVTGFKLSLYNNDDLMLGELKFGYDPVDERFYILIPNTYEDVPESAVNVACLDKTKKAIYNDINNIINSLEHYVTKDSMSTYLNPLKADLEVLKSLVGLKANQSDLDALRNQVNDTTTITNIKGLFWSQQKTYSHSTGGDIIIMPEIGQKYPGSELYQNCTYDEANRTLVLSDPLDVGTYMCVNPSRLYLGYTESGSVYNGNTTTSEIYSKSYERGIFAPVKI